MNGYLGSKAASGLFQNIISMMPPHKTYIETHLGGGAIMRKKPAAMKNIGIDIHEEPLTNFECSYPVELINVCAHKFLSNYQFIGDEVVYADPPYMGETRTSHNRYKYEYDDADHIELLTLLKNLPCAVIISGYPSALYDELLKDWNCIELQAMTRGGPRTEKIWFNYEIDRVHWAAYAGKDFTDRQRIKRKAHRWGENYKNLS
ncbi:DNA adenine methylase, partial [Moritella viscosa]